VVLDPVEGNATLKKRKGPGTRALSFVRFFIEFSGQVARQILLVKNAQNVLCGGVGLRRDEGADFGLRLK